MADETLKQQCEALGIHVMRDPLVPIKFTYLGVFPPGRKFESEDEACRAALAHYWAVQPEEKTRAFTPERDALFDSIAARLEEYSAHEWEEDRERLIARWTRKDKAPES